MRGSIQKREGKRGISWRIVVDIGIDPKTGNRKQKVETLQGTKADAQKRLREILTSLDKGIYTDAGKMTVSEYLQKWFEGHKRDLSPSTARRYAGIIHQHLIPALGQTLLNKLTPLHIREFIDKEMKEGRKDNKKSVGSGLSSASVNYEYRVLHNALSEAVALELLYRNPADSIKPAREEKKEIVVLSEKDISTLLNGVKDTYIFMPTFIAIYTGMRLGEILGLTWANIDLSQGLITVRQSSCQVKSAQPEFKTPKTSNSKRTIDISPAVINVLKEHKKLQSELQFSAGPSWNNYNLVCCLQNGYPINPPSLSSYFRQVTGKLGLNISFHGLRHTHASLLLKAGIPAKVVSERLGHSTIAITMDIYSHVMPGMQKEAANKLETMLSAVQ